MSQRGRTAAWCAVLAVTLGACAPYQVYQSGTAGHAYVVHGNDVYHCEAGNGSPRCWHVNEQGRAQ